MEQISDCSGWEPLTVLSHSLVKDLTIYILLSWLYTRCWLLAISLTVSSLSLGAGRDLDFRLKKMMWMVLTHQDCLYCKEVNRVHMHLFQLLDIKIRFLSIFCRIASPSLSLPFSHSDTIQLIVSFRMELPCVHQFNFLLLQNELGLNKAAKLVSMLFLWPGTSMA